MVKRVMLVSFYDETCYGGRCLAATLKEAGHQVLMVFFKRFRIREVSRDDLTLRRKLDEEGYQPCYETWPSFDVACPYPYPVSEKEFELFYQKIRDFAPDILGFSVMSFHLPLTVRLSKEVRQRFPSLMQVWGGVHATMNPDSCLEYADAVCVGEGEEAFLEFLRDPRRTDVRNFCTKDRDGTIIHNPVRPLIQDFDALPFALYADPECEVVIEDNHETSDVTETAGNMFLCITSQRGCPFKCTYCLHGRIRQIYAGQKYMRRRSVDRFLDEVALRVRQFGIDHVFFWDDVLMMDRKWVEEFAAKYPSRIGLPFGGYGHPQLSTPQILKLMREAGAYYVLVGMQSGSDYIQQKIYGRGTTKAKYIEFGRHIAAAGYPEIVYEVMIRNPFESEQDLKETIDLLSRMPKSVRVSTKHLALFPNTVISTLDAPRPGVSMEIFHFYNLLYFLAGVPGFELKDLAPLAENADLQAHPEILERLVKLIFAAEANRQKLEGEVSILQRRLDALEGTMPWGIKRSTRHLLGQIGNRLKRDGQPVP